MNIFFIFYYLNYIKEIFFAVGSPPVILILDTPKSDKASTRLLISLMSKNPGAFEGLK